MCIQNSVLKGELALRNELWQCSAGVESCGVNDISGFASKILAADLSVFLFISPSLSLFSFPPPFSFIIYFFWWVVITPSIWPVVPLESLLTRWHAHLSICICFHFDMSKEYVEIKSQLDATEVFFCRSYCLLNMFGAPLCPSSGAQEYYTVVAACGISCCKNVKCNL